MLISEYLFDFAFLPEEKLKEHHCRVVIDLLRASTQIVTFFDAGGSALVPCPEVEEAFALKEALGDCWKLMGERGGVRVRGFDYGNSPLELMKMGAPERAIITTSNGTKAIAAAALGCENVIIGCARNAEAAAWESLCRGQRVGVVASGRNGEFSMEDTICAGMLIEKLLALAPKNGASKMELTDGAIAALALWQSLGPDLVGLCLESEHGRILQGLGFTDDVLFCCETDASACVPRLVIHNGFTTLITG